MCVPPAAHRGCGGTGARCAARATQAPDSARGGSAPYQRAPAVPKGARRAAHHDVRAAVSVLRAQRGEHALHRPHDATALPGRRWQRACACSPCLCRRLRIAIAAQPTRAPSLACRNRCAACATRPPSPAGSGGGRAPCDSFVCHRRRTAIAAGRARAVPSTALPGRRRLRTRAVRPTSVPPAVHRDRGGPNTLRSPRDATAPPTPPLGRCWPRGAPSMCVPPAAHRDRRASCAARTTRPPFPAGAGGGRAPCGPSVCRRRRIASAAGRARAVPSARRDRPPSPPPPPGPLLAEGCAAPSMCVPPAAHRDRRASCAARTTRPPFPAGAGGGCTPCGPCGCR